MTNASRGSVAWLLRRAVAPLVRRPRHGNREGLVMLLAAALAAGALLLLGPLQSATPLVGQSTMSWWYLAAGFCVAEFVVAHVEIRKHTHSLSLSEALLIVGIVTLSPMQLVAARLVGALVALVIRRQSALKMTFNLAVFTFEAALASFLLHVVGAPLVDRGWFWATAGVAVWFAVVAGAIAVAFVISLVDPDRQAGLLLDVVRSQMTVALGTCSLSVIGAAAVASSPLNLVFVGVVALSAFWVLRAQARTARRATDLESVGGFTAKLVGLSTTPEVVDTSLQEFARSLRASNAAMLAPPSSQLGGVYQLDAAESVDVDALAAALAGIDRVCLLSGLDQPSLPDGIAGPITLDGDQRVVVVVWERSTDVGAFDAADVAMFSAFSDQARVALERALSNDRLAHAAYHDALTGLPNRLGLARKVEGASGDGGALLVMDLDRFKDINDTLGHPTGDRALRIVADRLATVADDQVVLGRLGGDEFALYAPGTDIDAAIVLANLVTDVLSAPIAIGDLSLQIGVSIGIAVEPDDGVTLTNLMMQADAAMFEAKRRQTGWQLYSPEVDTNTPRRLEILSSLRRAISGGELQVWYQPKVDLADRRVVGAEALVRWEHPQLGFVPPDEFVAIAEGAGLMKDLTTAVLENVVSDLGFFKSKGITLPVAVNLSTRDLLDGDLPQRIDTMVAFAGLSPADISFEITETAIMLDRNEVTARLNRLHELGYSFAVDDYGTGYSSLAYLRDLPVDTLKIDRSFICDLDIDQSNEVIVRSTIDLGHNLGLTVVAEGIEREGEFEALRRLGCDQAQGYLMSRPLPRPKLELWLEAHGVTGDRPAMVSEHYI
ncbi:MAG: bifunctional diguanylate cyclase/phosphodiesterase [Acidimicrobiales bacterium]